MKAIWWGVKIADCSTLSHRTSSWHFWLGNFFFLISNDFWEELRVSRAFYTAERDIFIFPLHVCTMLTVHCTPAQMTDQADYRQRNHERCTATDTDQNKLLFIRRTSYFILPELHQRSFTENHCRSWNVPAEPRKLNPQCSKVHQKRIVMINMLKLRFMSAQYDSAH